MPVARGRKGVEQEMRRFKEGKLHSGKGGPIVETRKQAIAIALSEAGLRKGKPAHRGRRAR